MARSVKCGLVLSLVCCGLAVCLPVLAQQPVPYVHLENVPGEVLIGETFTFTVVFENTGTAIGYGPFIDLVLASGGQDLNADYAPSGGSPGPCDGITFVSAKMVAVNPTLALTGITTPPTWSFWSCESSPGPGPISPHPYAEVDQHGVTPSGAPAMPVDIDVLVGAQLVTLELPFGSFVPPALGGQPSIVVEVTALVHNCATADFPLAIRARGGFRYGADADSNPTQDSPIVSDDGDSSLWVEEEVKPAVLTLKKEYLGLEDETVSGPNFVRTYRITVDVAEGQTLKSLIVADNLPGELCYADSLHVVVYDPYIIPTNVEPTGCPGGTLSVGFMNDAIIGQPGMSDEVVIEFSFYIPYSVLGKECANSPYLLTNDVWASCDWDPIDKYRDSSSQILSDETPADHVLQAKCMAIQKSVVAPVGAGPWPKPGSTLRYELRFQISDYHTIRKIAIFDQLSDGQRLVSSPAPPELTIQDQFGSYTVGFPAGTLTKTLDPSSDCICDAAGPVRGVTELVFDVSGALMAAPPSHPRHQAGILTGGLAAGSTLRPPAIGTLVFYAEVTDEFFVNTQVPGDQFVDKDDPINNCVEIRGEVLANEPDPKEVPRDVIGRANDTSHTCLILASGVLEKTVYAVKRGSTTICGPGNCGTVDVLPGDDVTFRIRYDIPSGDAENLSITDWLPLPVFNVNGPPSPLYFSSIISGTPPAAGVVACGPLQSPFVPGFLAPGFNLNQPSNGFSLDYHTPFNFSNTARRIDLLFTLTVTNKPFADGLYLTNEALECENNTFGMSFCQAAVAQVHVREPELSIRKGVIATDNPNGVFTPNPLSAGLPVTPPPSTSCPRFTGLATSASLGGFIGRDLSSVDAHDWVTFAIAIENTGGAPAYEIELDDIIPSAAAAGRPCCFERYFDGLCVTRGDGTPILYSPPTMVGPGHIKIELLEPLAPGDPVNPTGTNIAIITFDAKLFDEDQLLADCCENQAELVRYTSAADTGSVSYPNFVTAGFGGPFEDTASVCVGPRPYAKCVQCTSEQHTQDVPAVYAAIGEIVRFRLVSVIPEGDTIDFQIQDLLPVGLTYVGNPNIVFVTDSGPVTSLNGTVTWGTIPGDETKYGDCPGANLPTYVPDVAVSPFAFGIGQDPIFFVTSNNPAPAFDIHNPDHDANLELAIIEFNAQVDNIAANQDGVTLTNRFEVKYRGACSGSQVSSLSDPVDVHIVGPKLTLAKTASPTLVPLGGTVTYTLTTTNTGTADAFDIQFTDTLPTGLTLILPFPVPSGCTNCSSMPGNVCVTCTALPDQTSLFPSITYQAVVDPTATYLCNTRVPNTACVTWTSLPGLNGTVANCTGQATVGLSGATIPQYLYDNGERNGSSAHPMPALPAPCPPAPPNSPNPPNDYFACAVAWISVDCPCDPPNAIYSDVHYDPVMYAGGTGIVKVVECVYRDTDPSGNVTDTYVYTVTNQSVDQNGCGLCAFEVPNPDQLFPGSMQTDVAGWGGTWYPDRWHWAAPMNWNCQGTPPYYYGIGVGQSGRFWFTVPGPTVDMQGTAIGTLCDWAQAFKLPTTRPGQVGPYPPDEIEGCIERDVQTTATDHGEVRVEECVTHSLDGATDTYCYTVTNVSYQNNGCGICWFMVPNTGGVITVPGSQTGPWCANCLLLQATGWEWSAPADSCGIAIGQSAKFCFSVYGKTKDVRVQGSVAGCPLQQQAAASGVATTGPELIPCPDLVVLDARADCKCTTEGRAPGGTVCTVTVEAIVKNNGTADIPASQPFTVGFTSPHGGCTAVVTGGLGVGDTKTVHSTFQCSGDCKECPAHWLLDAEADSLNQVAECDETNNTEAQSVCCTPECPYDCAKAELKIVSLTDSCACGQLTHGGRECVVTVTVGIRNEGCTAAGGFDVVCGAVDNQQSQHVTGLGVGDTATLTFQIGFGCFSSSCSYSGFVMVDIDPDQVDECEEQLNNDETFQGICTIPAG